MNKKVIPLVVQLKQNNNKIVKGINQNDAGVLFDIQINDGLKAFDFSGASIVTLKIRKPDETYTYDSSGGEYVDIIDPVNGRLKINIPTSCTAQNGMHFCYVGFGYDSETFFETMSFNYFVGDNPNPEDDNIMGTDEFPILLNLIAQTSDAVGAETIRTYNEEERVTAETTRQNVNATLIALFVEVLGFLEEKITDIESMVTELNTAIAQGGSVDISQISALATKTYVDNALEELNFGSASDVKSNKLIIYHGNENDLGTLEEGEIAYATDTNKLFVGSDLINESCFIASASEPTDTTKLWIDTSISSTPVIKYHNGTTWVSCNRAVYA